MQNNTNLVKFIYPDELRKNTILSLDQKHDLKIILEFVEKHNINTNHPLFLNQLFGNTDEISIIAEKYIAEHNTSMYTYEMSPVFNLMEIEVTNKLKQLIGFEYCNSFFLPGGSLSNIEAINTARYFYNKGIKQFGNIQNLIVITSDQAHYSIEKGCALLGIGTNNLIKVPTDNYGRIIIDNLDQIILNLLNNNKHPFIIIGTAGTTVYGSFDNILGLIKIKKKYNIWLHIDGSFGGSIIFNNYYSNILLNGLNQVDSFCFNPHKLLNLNLQSCVLLINRKDISANYTRVDYLFNSDKFYDSNFDTGNKYFMCGRKPDIFKLWLVWKIKGIDYFSCKLNKMMEKNTYLKTKLKEYGNFNLIETLNSLCVCFFVKNSDPIKIKQKLLENNLAMITYQKNKDYNNFFRICFANSNCKFEDIDLLINYLIN